MAATLPLPQYAALSHRTPSTTQVSYLLKGTVREGNFHGFFGFFFKMNMGRSKVHQTGRCRENQALCVGQVSIELI